MEIANKPTPTLSSLVTPLQKVATAPEISIVQSKELETNNRSNKNIDEALLNITLNLNNIAKKENLDIDTGKVIRKIPSEEALKFREGMKELIGILFDRKI